ncbi:hypothetical protein [Amycolatopsis sp. NPDC004079]|uniref:hypothetical protein n=1 Tax=Amycolatopsis sp. NPDC004079 TaxID=3154549 RepID=UPI0033A76E8D
MIRKFGFLRYVHTVGLDFVVGEAARRRWEAGTESIFPAADNPGSAGHGAASTLNGMWALVAGASVNLERMPCPADVVERDRELGILPSKITRCWIETTDPGRVWDYEAGPVS